MNYDKKKKKLSALKVVFSHKKIAAANGMMLSAAIFIFQHDLNLPCIHYCS